MKKHRQPATIASAFKPPALTTPHIPHNEGIEMTANIARPAEYQYRKTGLAFFWAFMKKRMEEAENRIIDNNVNDLSSGVEPAAPKNAGEIPSKDA